jgi:hypothetical protein
LVSLFISKGYDAVVTEITIDTERGLNWTNLVFKK